MSLRAVVATLAAGAVLSSVVSTPAAATPPRWERIGPEGGVVIALAAAPSRPALLYAGLASGGVYKSLDRGRTWAFAGSGLARATSVFSLAVDALLPGTAWAGTADGLYKTVDGGGSWSLMGPDLRGSLGRLISTVAAHPRKSGVLWAAVHGGSTFMTRNGGSTWSVPAHAPENVSALLFDPVHPATLYAGTLGSGLFKSTDGGVTWARLAGGLPAEPLYVQALAIDPRNPDHLFAGLQEGLLYRSLDGGATWARSDNGLPHQQVHSLAVDPGRTSTVYAAVSLNGLFRSTDGGRSWRHLDGLGAYGQHDAAVVATASAVATSVQLNVSVSVSGDRGATWQAAHGITAASIVDLAISRQTPPRLYGLDVFGGILKTASGGASWLALPPHLGNAVVTGPLAIDPFDPQTLYVGGLGAFGKSTNGGRRWTPVAGLGCAEPISLFLDPAQPGTLYSSGIFAIGQCYQPPGACLTVKSTDGAQSWSCINAGLGTLDARLLALDPLAPNHLFAATNSLYRSTDAGAHWSLFAPDVNPDLLSFSPVQQGLVFASLPSGVGRSEDGGATWESYRDGIPQREAVNQIAADPADASVLYAATGFDVYRSVDGGRTWAPAGIGLGEVTVSDLEIDPADRSVLYVSTYGGSVMRLRQE